MAETTHANAPEATLEETLNKTDFGHWIFERRKPFLFAVALVFLGSCGWLWWKQAQKTRLQELAGEVHQFEMSALKELRDGKLDVADFTTRFTALPADVKTSAAMVPVALDAANLLREKGDAKIALQVLDQVVKSFPPTSPAYAFLIQPYVALAEDGGETSQAITMLEAYVASGQKVFLTKAYLDLGRLYLAKNEANKAKPNFEYIVANHPNDELAKLARLYLQRMTATP